MSEIAIRFQNKCVVLSLCVEMTPCRLQMLMDESVLLLVLTIISFLLQLLFEFLFHLPLIKDVFLSVVMVNPSVIMVNPVGSDK